MKRNKLLLFSSITIVVVIIAAFFTQSRAPQTKIEKEVLFPELANKINDVARIEVISDGDNDVILQRKENGQWSLENADNYPAKFDKIKNTVVSLSGLKILATKTDNPKLYPQLGVEDPGNKNTTSILLALSDQSGNELASLIVGKPKKRSTGSSKPNLYVRKPDSKNALLVEGYLQLKSKSKNWYERNIIHIPASRIQNVKIVKSAGNLLEINKNAEGDTDFRIVEGNTSAPSVLLNKLGTFLEDINVEGVHAADNFIFPDNATITTFKTFNGLVITVKNIFTDDKAYAHFSFTSVETSKNSGNDISADNPKAFSAEEESLLSNKFLSNWVYEIPEFKFETLNIDVAQVPE